MDSELAGHIDPVIGGEGSSPFEAELARIFNEEADRLEMLTRFTEPAFLIFAAGIAARREGKKSPEFDEYLLERLRGIVQSPDAIDIDLEVLKRELYQKLNESPKEKKFPFF